MAQSDVLVFPDSNTGRSNFGIDHGLLALLNQNGGFGGNGNWIWLMFMWMMWGYGGNGWGNGFGGNNGTGFLANQLNNDAGRDLLLQAINGRADALAQLAQMTNTSVQNVQSGIATINTALATLGGNIGLTGQQIISQILSGNAAISQQLCQCCCENRLAICQQTNDINSRIASMDADVRLQLAQLDGSDKLAVCQQTNQLGSQADRNTNAILGAIKDQNAMIVDKFCEIEKRELQDKINTQGDIITQLRGQIDNDRQTAQLFAALNPLQAKVNEIANKQPNTVPVQYPNLVAVNQTPYAGGYGYGWGNGVVF